MSVEDSPFDSGHYGVKVGRLVHVAPESLDDDLRDARSRQFQMLVARVDECETAATTALERSGASPLEVLVTLELDPSTERPPVGSVPVDVTRHERLVEPAEIARIAAITADAIGGSHLHVDPRLPVERTRALYAAWATNDVTGRAQQVFVARREGAIDGYVTVLVRGDRAIIDLVAVDPARHGKGTGSALLAAFVEWLRTLPLRARVGTQATNPALALYRRFGFRPATREATYHLWLEA